MAREKIQKPETVETAEPDEVEDDDQILDLDAIIPKRPIVKLGGKPYELRVLDDFGIEDQQQVSHDAREFQQLWSKEAELTKMQKARLKLLLDRLFNKVFDAPTEVRTKINDANRARIALFFQLAPLAEATAQQTEATEAADGSTMES